MVDYNIRNGANNKAIIEFIEYQSDGNLRKGQPGDSLGHPYSVGEFIDYIKGNTDKFEKNYRRVSHVFNQNDQTLTYNFFPKGNSEAFKVTLSQDVENYESIKADFQDIETALNLYNNKQVRNAKIKNIGVNIATLAVAGALVFGGTYAVFVAANGYNTEGVLKDTANFYKDVGTAIVNEITDDFKTTDDAFNEMVNTDNVEIQDGGSYKASRK